MENEHLDELEAEAPHYVPRPRWQVWLARVALAVFLIILALYYYNMFTRGGV